jgi:hypothetical protein
VDAKGAQALRERLAEAAQLRAASGAEPPARRPGESERPPQDDATAENQAA